MVTTATVSATQSGETHSSLADTILLKLPPSCTLNDAMNELIMEVNTDPDRFNIKNFAKDIGSIHCHGVSIRGSLNVALADIHDDKTPIEQEPIHVTWKHKSLVDGVMTSQPSGPFSNSFSPPVGIGFLAPGNATSISTVASSLTPPDGFPVFVELRCTRLSIGIKYYQFTAYSSELFADLYSRVVAHHRHHEKISVDASQLLLSSPVCVAYFKSSKSQLHEMIAGSLESSCDAILVSKHWYVRYTCQVSECFGKPKIVLSSKDVQGILMNAQNDHVLPKKLIFNK
jgi:hypothetical protein